MRRRWLDESSYADLIALCQLLPGPASSQLGIAVGISRAGIAGGIAAWLGFTLPSAAALILFGYGIAAFDYLVIAGLLQGLKVVAAAVVAFAVYGMARILASDARRATIAIAAAIVMLFWRTPLGQVLVISVSGVIGWLLLAGARQPAETGTRLAGVTTSIAVGCLSLFGILLAGLPLLRGFSASDLLDVFDGFYRSGALVFGGGHVVLPLLQAEVVSPGGVTERPVHSWLRRGAGGPRPAIHLLCLSGDGDGRPGERLERRPVHPLCHISAVVSAGDRRPAVLGEAAFDRPVPRRSPGLERRWWGCCSPPCTTRSGSPRFMRRVTLHWA